MIPRPCPTCHHPVHPYDTEHGLGEITHAFDCPHCGELWTTDEGPTQ